MPGCGKSTLARALCEAGLADMLDVDTLVETGERRTIPAIMRHSGEAEFRRLEAEATTRVAALDIAGGRPLVVSTGGGAPCHGSNMDTMLAAGTVVWLQADRMRSLERLAAAPGQRPGADAAMAHGRLAEWFDSLLAQRAPSYGRAHARFDSSQLDTPAQIAATVAAFARTFHLHKKNEK